jgi:hypothetical protein
MKEKWLCVVAVGVFTMAGGTGAMGAPSARPKNFGPSNATDARPLVAPDLVFESLTPHLISAESMPKIPTLRVTYDVAVVVRNQGTGPAGPFKVCLDRHLGTYVPAGAPIAVASLGPGGVSVLRSTRFVDMTLGVHYPKFRITVDCEQVVAESNEKNNVWEWTPPAP